MSSILKSFFPDKNFAVKYSSNSEYIIDRIKQTEMIMSYYLDNIPSYGDKMGNFRSDSISERSVSKDIFNISANKAKFDYMQAEFFILSRLTATEESGGFISFEYIKDLFNLSELEMFALFASIMPYVDVKYIKLFTYLQDDYNRTYPTYDLVLKLFYFVNDVSDIPDFYNVKKALKDKLSLLCFDEGEILKIDKGLYEFILSNGENIGDEKGISLYFPKKPEPLLAMDDIAQKICYTSRNIKSNKTIYYYMYGAESSGKKTQVKRFSDLMNMNIVMVDIKKVNRDNEASFIKSITMACRVATIYQGALCFTNLDFLQNDNSDNLRIEEYIIDKSGKFVNTVFLLSTKELNDKSFSENKFWVDIKMRDLTKEESIILWDKCIENLSLEEDVKGYELANKFQFTAGQIMGTMTVAQKESVWNQKGSLSKKELYKCAYTQIVHNLSKKADLIYAKYTWDQLILADDQKEMLKNACDQIKYKHIVYNKWGMDKRLSYGRGVSMLFAGPPGTGKTMGAQVVANELDIEIYKVDLSQIVSKYIGETEKNLNELFNEAKKSNVILFFDETDAILGKRTEVKDSHDKNANLETSYLLQKMEEYDGITVMTTNYLENIDSAFFRRISYVIHFPFPKPESREKIWRNMFPQEMPLSPDIDFHYLANQFEIAGGNIKNIAVSAAFLAAKSTGVVKMEHILKALKYELTKQGKNMLKEDFGEHAYLIK